MASELYDFSNLAISLIIPHRRTAISLGMLKSSTLCKENNL